jgi:hypothetical protein
MNEKIKKLTENLSKNASLNQEKFNNAISSINCRLPVDYIEFMRENNGGEGVIGENGWYVRLWPLEELIEANEDYNVDRFAPDLFLLGSDGGDTAFGLKREDGIFIEVPFIGMSNENAINRGENFSQFLDFLQTEV